jgi:hypothetical protein
MIHEQCRNGRDGYVEYNCNSIQGYGTALMNVVLASKQDASTHLCVDKDFAEKYGFDGSAHTENSGYVDFAGRFDESRFDMGSIMIYPSNAFANAEYSKANMDAFPLMGLYNINGRTVGNSWSYKYAVPSSGDVAFFKK